MSRWFPTLFIIGCLSAPAFSTGIAGVGFGPAFTGYSQKLESGDGYRIQVGRKNSLGIATDVYLGVDLNATTFLTLFLKANWIGFENDYQKYFAMNANTGLGILGYLSRDEESPFMLVGIGYSGLAPFHHLGAGTTPGIAPTLGLGYELKKHHGIQATVFYNNPSPVNTPNGYTVDVSAWSFQFNYIFQNR
jgi:hypothetical protein